MGISERRRPYISAGLVRQVSFGYAVSTGRILFQAGILNNP